MSSISMDSMNLWTGPHVVSPLQTLPVQPQFINLNQFEMSVVLGITQDATGQWACELCDDKFEDVMMLVTHLLTSHIQ